MIFHQCETFQEDRSIFFYLHLCEFKQKELKMLIIFWPERLWKVFTNSFYTIWNWANNFRAQVWSNLADLTDVPVLFFWKTGWKLRPKATQQNLYAIYQVSD